MWQAGLNEYDDLKGIEWKWQAADGTMTKAPLGGEKTGKNPTDRGKVGTKRSLLVNEQGLPLGIVVSGANTPDGRLLAATLDALPIERPDPATTDQHLCLDKEPGNNPCPLTCSSPAPPEISQSLTTKTLNPVPEAPRTPSPALPLPCHEQATPNKQLLRQIGGAAELNCR